jgi:hypothetical protein
MIKYSEYAWTKTKFPLFNRKCTSQGVKGGQFFFVDITIKNKLDVKC